MVFTEPLTTSFFWRRYISLCNLPVFVGVIALLVPSPWFGRISSMYIIVWKVYVLILRYKFQQDSCCAIVRNPASKAIDPNSVITTSNSNRPFVQGIHCTKVNSPHKGTRSFDVFFDLRLNIRWSKHSRFWWFETPWRSLWRHCNITCICHCDHSSSIWFSCSDYITGHDIASLSWSVEKNTYNVYELFPGKSLISTYHYQY